MKFIYLICLLISFSNLQAQRVIDKKIPVDGNIILTEFISIPKVNKGYTIWLPDTGKTEGLIVFTHARRDTINSEFIIDYALSKQFYIECKCKKLNWYLLNPCYYRNLK